MAGGLPGVGIGGVFFVAAGLLMPFVEVWRVLRGRSEGDRWPWIIRHFFIALAIVAVVAATFILLGQAFETTRVIQPGALQPQTVSTSSIGSISFRVLVVIMGLVLAVPLMQRLLMRPGTNSDQVS